VKLLTDKQTKKKSIKDRGLAEVYVKVKGIRSNRSWYIIIIIIIIIIIMQFLTRHVSVG